MSNLYTDDFGVYIGRRYKFKQLGRFLATVFIEKVCVFEQRFQAKEKKENGPVTFTITPETHSIYIFYQLKFYFQVSGFPILIRFIQ